MNQINWPKDLKVNLKYLKEMFENIHIHPQSLNIINYVLFSLGFYFSTDILQLSTCKENGDGGSMHKVENPKTNLNVMWLWLR